MINLVVVTVEHQWQEGEWYWSDFIEGWFRKDICKLCGCVRADGRDRGADKTIIRHYYKFQEGDFFGRKTEISDHEPACHATTIEQYDRRD